MRTCKHSRGIGYADSTIFTAFTLLSACVELAKDLNKIPDTVKNLYAVWLDKDQGLLKLPPKKKILVYNADQIQIIVNAFRNDTYSGTEKRKFKTHSKYTNFVLFRFLTGLRPSETVCLTWNDIKWDGDQPKQIVISKRKVSQCDVDQGQKITHLTNVQARIIPCNKDIRELILAIKQVKHPNNPHNLLFPAPRGGYINQSEFNDKIWSKVIKGLVSDGLLPYPIPFYDERHCNATHMNRSGVDPKTASTILGHSVNTYMNYYVGADEGDDVVPN
ncbi:MAG TPA: tyrosine-type recombinase/integrase, partial [Allocoleopsis sp.]